MGDSHGAPSPLSPVSVQVSLREYLIQLEASESIKPPHERRAVPSLPSLAAAAGFTRQGLYNLAGGNIKMLNLEVLSKVMNELRRHGFPVEVSHLLTAYPIPSDDSPS